MESIQSQMSSLTDSLTASGKTSLTSCANTPVSSPSHSLVSKPACSMYSRLYRYLYSFILDTLRSCSLVSTWKKSSMNQSVTQSINRSVNLTRILLAFGRDFTVISPGLPRMRPRTSLGFGWDLAWIWSGFGPGCGWGSGRIWLGFERDVVGI